MVIVRRIKSSPEAQKKPSLEQAETMVGPKDYQKKVFARQQEVAGQVKHAQTAINENIKQIPDLEKRNRLILLKKRAEQAQQEFLSQTGQTPSTNRLVNKKTLKPLAEKKPEQAASPDYTTKDLVNDFQLEIDQLQTKLKYTHNNAEKQKIKDKIKDFEKTIYYIEHPQAEVPVGEDEQTKEVHVRQKAIEPEPTLIMRAASPEMVQEKATEVLKVLDKEKKKGARQVLKELIKKPWKIAAGVAAMVGVGSLSYKAAQHLDQEVLQRMVDQGVHNLNAATEIVKQSLDVAGSKIGHYFSAMNQKITEYLNVYKAWRFYQDTSEFVNSHVSSLLGGGKDQSISLSKSSDQIYQVWRNLAAK